MVYVRDIYTDQISSEPDDYLLTDYQVMATDSEIAMYQRMLAWLQNPAEFKLY